MKIEEVKSGKCYNCDFVVTTALDTMGRPWPNLSDTPYGSKGEYKSTGQLIARDLNSRLVEIKDYKSAKTFVVEFDSLSNITEDEMQPETA